MKIQISHSIVNQLAWYKFHNTQQGKNYTKHGNILRKEMVETLLVFEEKCETVLFGWCWLEQMEIMVDVDGFLKHFSSAHLNPA
jgi:hypothetical protein